jgi:phosphate acetyltransferase
MDLIKQVKDNAKKNKQRIILPESYDNRVLKAADKIISENIADITLIGKKADILRDSENLKLKNIDRAKIVDPEKNNKKDIYASLMVDIRKSKGLTMDEAYVLLDNPLYLSTIMIKNGDADGEVAGAANATPDVLRPALQLVKTKPGINIVSGAFLMILKDKEFGNNGLLIFADCAVNPCPTATELAEIAVTTARTTMAIAKTEPRIAMLSFSTKGSTQHELVDKVRNATALARQMDSTLKIDGELQADAALIKEIAGQKAPGSEIAGTANVLIFPDLQSGNIAYKLVQRLAHAEAIGPVIQGLASPINDLSRGCSVDDIVNLVAITANQAMAE